MTQKQRVIDQINHRSTDYVPIGGLGYEGDVAERLDAHYGSSRWRSLIEQHTHIKRVLGASKFGLGVDPEAPRFTDAYGLAWRTDLRPRRVVAPPLREPTLEGYRFPEVADLLSDDWRKQATEQIAQGQDRFLVNGVGNGLFLHSMRLRGHENGLMDSIAEPVFYEQLVEGLFELYMKLLDEVLTVPVDGVFFNDDWGDQRGISLGPERWRRFIKPYYARMLDKAHKAGKYVLHHSCGNVQEIIPDLIEIGLDVLQTIQPEVMDPYFLKREYGKDIAFWGGLSSQSLVPFGQPAEIRAEVGRLCREMGEGGGYILGPAKDLQPETPTENAGAVVESFLEEAGVACASESATS